MNNNWLIWLYSSSHTCEKTGSFTGWTNFEPALSPTRTSTRFTLVLSQLSIHLVMFVFSRRDVVYHKYIVNMQQIRQCPGEPLRSPVSALFPTSPELKQKTTKPNWWASKEKCPWSHLNQSFLQAGFSLIWGCAPLHILIVFPWSATMTPQMFIQRKIGSVSAPVCTL